MRNSAPSRTGDGQSRSLIRTFGAHGSPQARNLFSVTGYLQSAPGASCTSSQGRDGVRHRRYGA
jgi:hypothetical protein